MATRRVLSFAALILFLATQSCGVKGPPLPPLPASPQQSEQNTWSTAHPSPTPTENSR